MKLPPLSRPLSFLPGDELLSPSLPNSVCGRKKTSLSGWLPLPQVYITRLMAHLPPAAEFHPRLMSSSSLLKLQITSSPA